MLRRAAHAGTKHYRPCHPELGARLKASLSHTVIATRCPRLVPMFLFCVDVICTRNFAGTVIFACHKVNTPPSRSTATSSATMQMGYNAAHYSSPQSQSYYDQATGQYSLPPLSSTGPAYGSYAHQSAPYSPQRWSAGSEQPGSAYNQWASPSPAHSNSPLPPTVCNLPPRSDSPHQIMHLTGSWLISLWRRWPTRIQSALVIA